MSAPALVCAALALPLLTQASPPTQDAAVARGVEVAFRIPGPELIPEGIAHDPATGAFYVGSTWRRKIVRVDSLGRASDFTAEAQDGLWGVVGMDVDAERRILWAASSHAGAGMPMRDAAADEEGFSGLWGYDVDTGRLVERHLLDPAEGPSFLNDLALGPDGTVYATDSMRNALYRLRPGGSRLERFAELPRSPNGIDLSADGRFLFVAQRGLIGRVEVASREVVLLDKPPEVPLEGMDGLYVHEGDLVVVGGVGEGADERWFVGRYALSGDGRRIVAGHDLLPWHPALRQPTTGVIVDDAIYVVANSQLQDFRARFEEGRAAETAGLDDPVVLRVPLDPRARAEATRASACEPGSLEVAYVANEGFLLSSGGERVLVDALFRDGLGAYATPEGDLRERLEGARGEFGNVDVLLATHPHRDHFSAAAAGAHLRANPAATLVAPTQAADSVRVVLPDAEQLLERVRPVSPGEGGRQAVQAGAVRVEALGLPHGPSQRPVEHAGWLVHLGGRTVVHLGDAEVQRARYHALGLSTAGVDVALVPYWTLLDSDTRAVVLEELRPRRLVAMHVDVGEAEGVEARLRDLVPGTWVPTAPGERLCVAPA